MSTARMVISLALLSATFGYLTFFTSTEVVPIRKPLDELPATIGSWGEAQTTVLDDDVLDVLRPSDYALRRYVDPVGRSLWLYVGYWQSQRKGAQIHSPKNCLPGNGWEPLDAARKVIPVPGRAEPIEVNLYVLQKGSARQVVVYWFESRGEAFADELRAKLELVRNSIAYNRSDAAIVRISSPVYGSLDESVDRLVKYVQAIYPILDDFLPN